MDITLVHLVKFVYRSWWLLFSINYVKSCGSYNIEECSDSTSKRETAKKL